MKKTFRRAAALWLSLVLICGSGLSALAAPPSLEDAIRETGKFMYETVQDPQVGSIGGEWAVLGLARSGYSVPEEYYQKYYAAVESYVKEHKGNLHDKKYTEYSRVIVALSAIGRDPRDVAGYDLTRALGDYDKTIWQGLNGPIWALIALDTKNYPLPKNEAAKTQATRQMYVDRILECQLPDGGWSLTGGTSASNGMDSVSDPDITGMALQALAKYQDQPAVAKATEEALTCMSRQQNENGGFSSWGTPNSESCVQMIVALCELGIPVDDPRFVKNGRTLLDNLMTFYQPGKGFLHTLDGSGSSQMSSEQGFYALAAVYRQQKGESSLYRMGDSLVAEGTLEGPKPGEGLPEKNPAVTPRPVVTEGTTFPDIQAHPNQKAIEDLAARSIIAGKSNGSFDPDGNMTRAEFAAIVVKSLGLTPKADSHFTDVSADAWYAGFVGAAHQAGIVTGVGDGSRFHPEGTISRQEAGVMVARAAKLCGMDPSADNMAVRDLLAPFRDYVTVAEWARESLAFCYREKILEDNALDIRPNDPIRRCEIAQMLFQLLGEANLLK